MVCRAALMPEMVWWLFIKYFQLFRGKCGGVKEGYEK